MEKPEKSDRLDQPDKQNKLDPRVPLSRTSRANDDNGSRLTSKEGLIYSPLVMC
jgi:hypothetical protein